jgi:hypothetical protein
LCEGVVCTTNVCEDSWKSQRAHGRPRLKVENPYEYVDCKLLIALWNALSYYPNNVTVCCVRFYLVLEMVRAPSCRWNDPTRYFLAMPNGATGLP